MTLSEAWDRMFWSLMIIIFVGLLWMKFLQETAACESAGLVVAVTIGIVFFSTGWYQARRKRDKLEAEARRDSEEVL